MENNSNKNSYVWPDLAFMEFLTAVALTIILIVWALLVNAPLMEIANPGISENPAKAPWYFVGLQELLVYFDPWIAGVMIPLTIVGCLALIPYLNSSRQGSGEYNFTIRKFAILNFIFGFMLWLVLIFIGYYLRGPDWQFYWPGESWEIIKPIANELWSMTPITGGIFLLCYFGAGIALPRLLNKSLYERWGRMKYLVIMLSILMMYFVPVKIFLRLAFDIRYVLVTPWFNI